MSSSSSYLNVCVVAVVRDCALMEHANMTAAAALTLSLSQTVNAAGPLWKAVFFN